MKSSKKKKIITAILGSLAGVSGSTIASMVIAYDAIYPRFERPNYLLKPGQYCIDRIKNFNREEFYIPSNTNKLKAYLYLPKNCKGLIVFVHGIRVGADDYLPIFKYLFDNDFGVLSFDATGTYDSEGESTVGACQSLVDLDNVIKFVKNDVRFNCYPLFTMGHSLGGYAASSVLALKDGIRACAVISAVKNGATIMTEKGAQYAGKIAKVAVPVYKCYQGILFGKYTGYDGIKGINESNIPVFIAHGVDDKVITYDVQSIFAYKDKITNPSVRYYIGKGINSGHDSIWHSEKSLLYKMQVESELKLLQIKYGRELSEQEKIEFFKTVDNALYSEVNTDLLDQIIEMFNETV